MPRVFKRRPDVDPTSSVAVGVNMRADTERVERLETASTRPVTAIVSTLPSNPFDGQEVRYQSAAMATEGVVWTFKYRAASASAYKWEFIGGPPLFRELATLVGPTTVTSYASWGGNALTVEIPLAGVYVSTVSCGMQHGTDTENGYMTFAGGGVTAADARALNIMCSAASGTQSKSRTQGVTFTAPGTITEHVRTRAGTNMWMYDRHMSFIPVRVAA